MSTIRVFAGRIYRFIQSKLTGFARPAASVIVRKAPPVIRIPRVGRVRPQPRLLGRIWERIYAGARTARWANLRAGFASTWVRGRQYWYAGPVAGAGVYFAGFQDAKVDNVFERIREYFSSEQTLYDYVRLPRNLDGYDIGGHIAKGCNAVVYEARLKAPAAPVAGTFAFTSKIIQTFNAPPEKNTDKTLFQAQQNFPLAIKIMFNYETLSNEDLIVREMGGELVPCADKQIKPFLKWHKTMNGEHPNIVKIFTAFVDVMPRLPDAEKLYPAALPSSMYEEGVGRNQTLFLVMKRYTMTLREYLLCHNYPVRTGQILFGQLLEALAYLHECKISHRDLKSNNILVDFDEDDEPPRLVLADFGCCLSKGDFHLAYPHNDVDLGGNVALRAPEIIRRDCGEYIYLNFSKADLWAAGSLALEIFTKHNPFYADPRLNESYQEAELPVLKDPVPRPVSKLVEKMLKIDPDERPSPICAANVLALSLFGVNYIQELLARIGVRLDLSGKKWAEFRVRLADAVGLYAVETLLGRLPDASRRISRAEDALRSAFLCRIDVGHLVDAVQYFDGKT